MMLEYRSFRSASSIACARKKRKKDVGDLKQCCKMNIYSSLAKSVLMQAKTGQILPAFCNMLAKKAFRLARSGLGSLSTDSLEAPARPRRRAAGRAAHRRGAPRDPRRQERRGRRSQLEALVRIRENQTGANVRKS